MAVTTIRTPVNSKDEQFFKTLGTRIALARKARNLTQHQLCAQLGIAQQTLANYEGGHLRLPASMLPVLAQIFGMSPDEMLGYEKPRSKRGPSSRLQQQVERISQLPKTKQHVVMEMLDAFIAQAGH